jgi:hypothetical protein
VFRNLAKELVFQQLIFQRWIAERPFRLGKLTACRKKFAFLSTQRHEVKAPEAEKGKIACSNSAVDTGRTNGDHCHRLQADRRLPSIDDVLRDDLLPVDDRWPDGTQSLVPFRAQDMLNRVILGRPIAPQTDSSA